MYCTRGYLMEKPLDHILRPILPWREHSNVTECGKDAENVSAITPQEYRNRVKEFGVQRAGLFTCMTCSETYSRHNETWRSARADDPRLVLARELDRETQRRRRSLPPQLHRELQALGELVSNHGAEFKEILDRIKWNERKAVKAEATKLNAQRTR